MGYEDGGKIMVVEKKLTDGEIEARAREILAHREEIKKINEEKLQAQKELEDLNGKINDRKKALAEEAARTVADLDPSIEVKQHTIEALDKEVATLSDEIQVKLGQRESILLDFAAKENALASERSALDERVKLVAERESQIRINEGYARQRNSDLALAKTEFEREQTEWDASRQTQLDELTRQKQDVQTRDDDVTARETRADIREKAIIEREDSFAIRYSSALQTMVDADEIRRLHVENDRAQSDLTKQREQLNADANQIRTQMIANKEKADELDSRELAVKQAEKKLGGTE